MPRKETSKTVASKASRVLKDKDASPEAKSIAASALAQAPDEPKAQREWSPKINEPCLIDGFVGMVKSFRPLVVTRLVMQDGVRVEEATDIDSLDKIGLLALTKEDIAQKLNG